MLRKPCRACGLSAFRRNIVKGRGSVPARLLFISEAPGRTEDLTGNALSGADGKLLEQLIADAGISCSYYITNCCCCRPCDSKVLPNREPEPHEILACMPQVMQVVKLVNPERVILLGKVAAHYYRREFKQALCLVHPVFLLRGGGRASPHYAATLRSLKTYTEDLWR